MPALLLFIDYVYTKPFDDCWYERVTQELYIAQHDICRQYVMSNFVNLKPKQKFQWHLAAQWFKGPV